MTRLFYFNCAIGLKYPLPEVTNMINKNKKINYELNLYSQFLVVIAKTLK